MNTDNETLQDLARALDQAISSNSPAVRKQFEQLMVLLALTQSTGDNRLPGPFEQMIQNVEALARRCEQLDQRLLQVEMNKNTYQNPFQQPGQPIWTTTPLTTPNTSSPGYGAIPGTVPGGGNWTIGSVGSASDTITLTGASDYTTTYNYNDVTLTSYPYENTMVSGAAGTDVLTTSDIDKLIEQMSITVNKEKKNA